MTATLGYQRGDLCHREYLPVYLGEEAVYLDAMGMIVTTPVLDQVNCQGVLSPIFQTIDGRLIQAYPQIVEVKMTLSKPGKLFAVLSVRIQGFAWKTALQLNFNLDGQVRDSLLRNAPVPAPSEDLGTRPAGTMGTLALSE